jgi:hypothetical protein
MGLAQRPGHLVCAGGPREDEAEIAGTFGQWDEQLVGLGGDADIFD